MASDFVWLENTSGSEEDCLVTDSEHINGYPPAFLSVSGQNPRMPGLILNAVQKAQ